jgi:hypothetical protein
MKLRSSFGTALAAAAGVLALTAAPALAAAPVAHTAVAAQARTATHLTLKASTTSTAPGAWVTLTAHLDKHGANRTVVVYGQDWAGGKPFVVGKGAVDKHGNLTVRYHDYQNHSFWATFSGGTSYAPATSARTGVRVGTAVSAALAGYYTTTHWAGHTVRVFHETTNIWIKGAISPNKGTGTLTIQVFYKGKWMAGDAGKFATAANGTFSLNTQTDRAIGTEFRVLVSSPATARNGAGYSSWMYLTATK